MTAPGRETLLAALALAVHAPSVHNTQPWRWRFGRRSVHLYADPLRWLPATDPAERDLLMSCGAALHHARVALAALGWAGTVHRLPNPAYPDHLAAIELHPREPSLEVLAMATAIPHRRSDRRRYASWPVPQARYREYSGLAAAEGVVLHVVSQGRDRTRVVEAIAKADQLQRSNPQAAEELARWSGRGRWAEDGVPAASVSEAASYGDLRLRPYAGTPDTPGPSDGAGELLVLGTASDDRVAALKAGEAASAVLLAATTDGLASCPLSQPLEVGSTRARMTDVLGGDLVPHMIIRIGWPTLAGHPLPKTPRRPADEVLDPQPA